MSSDGVNHMGELTSSKNRIKKNTIFLHNTPDIYRIPPSIIANFAIFLGYKEFHESTHTWLNLQYFEKEVSPSASSKSAYNVFFCVYWPFNIFVKF